MNKFKVFFLILIILLGIFIIIFGENDDSPGAQLLGLIIAISGVFGVFKSKIKKI